MSKPTTPVAGARAGRYLFVRQITTSYTGALWEARCESDGGKQFLALTRVVTLPAEMDAGVEECLASAAWDAMELDGEGIARVAEVVFEKGWFAIVHDHYDGDTVMTLQRRITERKSAFPVPVALRILLDAIEAAQHAHSAARELDLAWRAALHPGSLFVCDDGRTRLLDGFMSGVIPTIPNMVREADTLAYAAPEQFKVGTVPDELGDVFALGILAWELLSSKRFHVGSRQVMERRLQTAPSRVDQMSRVGKRASRAVADAVNRALSLERGERFESLEAFAKALRAGDDGVASQQEVIEFTDALAGRESTLARLLMDKAPRLSDELRQGRTQARPGDASGKSPAKQSKDKAKDQKKAVRAPDAMFKPTPAVARPAKVAGPAIFGAKAAESAGQKMTQSLGTPSAAQEAKAPLGKYGSPLAPPLQVPNKKQTIRFAAVSPSPSPAAQPKSAPAATPIAASAQASPAAGSASPEARPMARAATPNAQSPKARNRMSTLIGLSAQDVRAAAEAARVAAPEPEEPPREPDSGITEVQSKHQAFDDADEEPTTIFRIGESKAQAQQRVRPAAGTPAKKGALDLTEEEQELETREYSQDMLAEALKDVPGNSPQPTAEHAGSKKREDNVVVSRAAVPRAFVKPIVAQPAVPGPLPAPNPPPPVAPAKPPVAAVPAVPAPVAASPTQGAPASRLPAPSSPGFEPPTELPALEHSGPAAVLPELKPAVLPNNANVEMAPASTAQHQPVAEAAPPAAVAPPATAQQAQPASVKRYRLVALFFAGTTVLMAAAAVLLLLRSPADATKREQPAPAAVVTATPVTEKKEPAPVKQEPEPSAEASRNDEARASEDGDEQQGEDDAAEGDDTEAKDDAEGDEAKAEEDGTAAEAEAKAAPPPKPARRYKPKPRAKPKPKSTSTRYVPTDI